MPEWHEPEITVPMGLWDLQASDKGLERVPDEAVMSALSDELSRWPACCEAPDLPLQEPVPYP